MRTRQRLVRKTILSQVPRIEYVAEPLCAHCAAMPIDLSTSAVQMPGTELPAVNELPPVTAELDGGQSILNTLVPPAPVVPLQPVLDHQRTFGLLPAASDPLGGNLAPVVTIGNHPAWTSIPGTATPMQTAPAQQPATP
jgi:hypothetical protein